MRTTCFISAGAGSPRRSVVIRMGSPWTITLPEFGVSNKLMQRRSVLLPEPDAPNIEMTSPVFAISDTPRSTSRSPKRLCRSLITKAGSVPILVSNEIYCLNCNGTKIYCLTTMFFSSNLRKASFRPFFRLDFGCFCSRRIEKFLHWWWEGFRPKPRCQADRQKTSNLE